MTDADLLRRFARDQSQVAFSEFVVRRIGLVYSTALRRLHGDRHLAEDVTQVVFTDLARKAESLSRHPALVAWLHASTHFTAAKALRTRQRRAERERKAEIMREIDSQGSSPAWAEVRPVLDDALINLTPRDREAILLRYFEGRPLAAIGEELGVTENAAKKAVDRALDKLRSILARRGIASTTAALAAALTAGAAQAAPAGLASRVTASAAAEAAVAAAPGLARLLSGAAAAKMAVVVAAVATAVAIASVSHELMMRRAAEASARQAETASRALSRKAEEMEQRTLRLERELASAQTRLTDQVSGQTSGMAENADLQRLLALQVQAQVQARYAPLLRQLNLPPNAQAELESLLVEAQLAPVDLAVAAAKQGIDPRRDTAGFQRLAQESADGIDRQMRALLGDDGFARYQAYQKTLPARVVAEKLAESLSYGADPLRPDQSERLVTLLAAQAQDALAATPPGPMLVLSTANASGGAVNTVVPVAPKAGVISDQALEQARFFLNSEQWDALRKLQLSQRQLQTQLQTIQPSADLHAH